MRTNKKYLITALVVLAAILTVVIFYKPQAPENEPIKDAPANDKKINTMLMLIEFEEIDGILQWEKELDQRGLTALIKVQDNILEENPEVFKRLADKGYEIAGGYDTEPFWGMPYDKQYNYLEESKKLVEEITGKKMRVFGSRYFAYDETTLKAADDLEIDYILGRGVNDVEATIYHPEEYNVKIISVTNVDVGEPMGRGSLCDYSLWARGAGAEEFGEILDESIAKNPNNMILVSHSYLGGTRLEWWNQYKRALGSNKISWEGFDSWLENQTIISLPNAEIPLNNEVKYVQPAPAKAMSDYEEVPGLGDILAPSSHNEMMCY